MLKHAVLAAVIFFVFQRFGVGTSLEISALWAGVGAVGAAALAYSQHRRGN